MEWENLRLAHSALSQMNPLILFFSGLSRLITQLDSAQMRDVLNNFTTCIFISGRVSWAVVCDNYCKIERFIIQFVNFQTF